jgi:hypothetical protein
MKTNDNSFFTEPVDARQEARLLALEVVCRLLIWMAEGASLEERGVRATVALYCLRPDLIGDATMEEIGHGGGRSRQAVHQLADILANKLVRALKPQLGKTTEEQGEAYRRDLRALYEKLRPWFESTP